MSFVLEAIRAGTTYALDDTTIGIRHLDNDGFGAPPVQRLTQRSPMQHGSTDIGFYLTDRKINLVLAIFAATEAAYYEGRARLLEIFKPGDDAVTLKATYPTGHVLQLDAHLEGGLMFGTADKSALSHKVVVPLTAPDPLWYDPTEETLTWAVSGTNGFGFPIHFPIRFVSAVISSGQVVIYPGSWLTYPTIVITGPAENPNVQNLTTSEKLELLYNVAAGQVVTFDLSAGEKSITDGTGANLIGALTDDSDLATFHLAADPEATGGSNTIKVTLGGAISGQTGVEVSWFNRYVGI